MRKTANLKFIGAVAVHSAGLTKQGSSRDIPPRSGYDDTHDRRYGIFVHAVTDAAGRSITYQVSTGEAMTEIKIGDPGRTITGKQTYRISYTITGALNGFADHEELFWNVNGGGWGVPMAAVGAAVVAPRSSVQKVTCFQGPTGSTEPCRAASTADGASFAGTRPFATGEQLSI